MKPVLVIGAGFSGLTLAYALRQLDLPVRILERGDKPGGLLSTRAEEHGLVETAANALLADAEVERLFADLELEYATQLSPRKRRYIFWNKPKRWPLSLWTSLKFFKFALLNFLTIPTVLPRVSETVAQWAKRVVNAQFGERLLAPALQGIYAGDVERLSASLSLTAMLRGSDKGRRRGSVAPKQGMGDLITALINHLKELGVDIEYGSTYTLPEKLEQPTVICTSAWAAADVVGAHDPKLAESLSRCESLPLISVTAFFPPDAKDVKGFGCLFPEAQEFKSLGVLFNDCIFAGRSSQRSETWILGGARNREVIGLSDDDLKKIILADRERIATNPQEPLAMFVTRWPNAIPHYTVEWEDRLRHLKVNRPLFLHGNYLGQLGLARISARSKALAAHLKDLYVS